MTNEQRKRLFTLFDKWLPKSNHQSHSELRFSDFSVKFDYHHNYPTLSGAVLAVERNTVDINKPLPSQEEVDQMLIGWANAYVEKFLDTIDGYREWCKAVDGGNDDKRST